MDEARLQAIRSLAALGARERARDIARFFGHPDVDLRTEAVRAAIALGARELAPDLARLIDDPEFPVQRLAIETLAEFGGPDEASAIARFLEAPPEFLAVELLETLARIGSPEHAAMVATYLDDPEYSTRAAAILALVRLAGPEARAAAERLLLDRAAGVREAAARALSEIEGTSVRLEPLLDDPSPEVRRTVARLLGRTGSEASLSALARSLDGASPAARMEAAYALGSRAGELLGPELGAGWAERLRAAAEDPFEEVRLAAGIGLVAIGAPDAPSLEDLATRASRSREGARLLEMIGAAARVPGRRPRRLAGGACGHQRAPIRGVQQGGVGWEP